MSDTDTLDLSEIDDIFGSTRSKTDSAGYLRTFLESGKLGQEIDLESGTFIGKSAKQVKMALDVARKKVSDETGNLLIPGGTDLQIRVKQETNGEKGDKKKILSEHVYIINTRLVAEARKAQNGNQ